MHAVVVVAIINPGCSEAEKLAPEEADMISQFLVTILLLFLPKSKLPYVLSLYQSWASRILSFWLCTARGYLLS